MAPLLLPDFTTSTVDTEGLSHRDDHPDRANGLTVSRQPKLVPRHCTASSLARRSRRSHFPGTGRPVRHPFNVGARTMTGIHRAKYRDRLPQRDGGLFLSDGGLETTLIFHDGFNLPMFASFVLVE